MVKQIHKYDLNGNYLQSYQSITEAAKDNNRDESVIRKAAHIPGGISANFLWSFHKRANYYDTDVIDDFLTQHNIPPEEVTKTRVQETKDGLRISVETKRTPELTDEDLRINALTTRSKQLQRKTDELRVIKKEFRENARVENTLTALNEALITILTNQTYKPVTYEFRQEPGPVIIVQLSDLHFNELVQLPDNYYGFEVGAKRLQKYANKIHKLAEVYNAKSIVLALTGDMLNSDRRLDEMMNQATNRMKASVLASRILYHFIQDLNHSGNVTILSVSGNESRIKEESGMSAYIMSDNYDYLIFNMLKLLFRDSKGITFIDGDPVEQVININGSNILIQHGTSIKEGQAYMQQIFGKYAAKGILIDYAIFGHVHFTNITDIYSRSGSLVGNNVYSDRSLNLVTKASQVVHIVGSDGAIDSLKINLQYCDGFEGYDIKDDLTAYNSQSKFEARDKETIVQVVI
jgi:predicted phosphodiesterase